MDTFVFIAPPCPPPFVLTHGCEPMASYQKWLEKNDPFWKGKQSGSAEVGEPQDMHENN